MVGTCPQVQLPESGRLKAALPCLKPAFQALLSEALHREPPPVSKGWSGVRRRNRASGEGDSRPSGELPLLVGGGSPDSPRADVELLRKT